MDTIRIGIIGLAYGAWAARVHGQLMLNYPICRAQSSKLWLFAIHMWKVLRRASNISNS
jgi:hypothetical protein